MNVRTFMAWALLIGSIVGWPISAFWLARDEPQFVLALSWGAITLTALDILHTVEVRNEQESKGRDDGLDKG